MKFEDLVTERLEDIKESQSKMDGKLDKIIEKNTEQDVELAKVKTRTDNLEKSVSNAKKTIWGAVIGIFVAIVSGFIKLFYGK